MTGNPTLAAQTLLLLLLRAIAEAAVVGTLKALMKIAQLSEEDLL